MRRAVTYIAVAMLLAPLPCVSAQVLPLLGMGERIRVTHHCPEPGAPLSVAWCKIHTGTVDVVTADSLVLTSDPRGTRLMVPVGSVRHIRVRRRLSRKTLVVRGAAIGGGILAFPGLVLGLSTMSECQGLSLSPCGGNFGTALLVTATVGGIGASIGSLFGLVSPRGQRWEKVPLDRLRVSFAPQRDGQSAFGLSVSF
jgi:hypothetical protein